MLSRSLRASTVLLRKHGCVYRQEHTQHHKLVETSQCNGIREIVLDDEKTRNSLSMSMMDDILEDLTCGWDDKTLRCIILSAKGPVFSAGHNLKQLVGRNNTYHRKVFAKCAELCSTVLKAPVPVIAKVDGISAAAGMQLVASCDIVICSDRSTFSAPGANVGIFCSTPGIALARAVPRMKASYMLFTGLPMCAKDAYIAGLASVVVPAENLDSEVKKTCDAIIYKSREVVALGKEFYYKQISMSIEDAYKHGVDVMTHNLSLEDGVEGIESFVQKRKPKWKG